MNSIFADESRPMSVGEAAGFVLLTDVIPDVILEIRYYSTFNLKRRKFSHL